MGGIHLILSDPIVSERLSAIQVPLGILQAAGWSFMTLAIIHCYQIVRMIYASARSRNLAFRVASPRVSAQRRQQSSVTAALDVLIKSPPLKPTADHVRSAVSSMSSAMDVLFGIDGYLGFNGHYFHIYFAAIEMVETIAQTYQEYQLTLITPSAGLRQFAAALTLLNCFSIPTVTLFTRGHETWRRLIHVSADMILELCTIVFLPFCVCYPYVSKYDWSKRSLPMELAWDDAWSTEAPAAARQLLLTSEMDAISSLLPHVFFLFSIHTIKDLLHRAKYQPHVSRPNSTVSIVPSTESTPPGAQLSLETFRGRRRKFAGRHWICYAGVLVWAVGVLVIHLLAEHGPPPAPPLCRSVVRPWFASRPACLVMQIHCHHEGHDGDQAKLAATLSTLDRTVLLRLIFSHCPELVMPPVITEFTNLRSIELFNCSIAAWPMTAAVDERSLNRINFIFLVQTNMTELPRAVAHANLPQSLKVFIIHRSNLSALPVDLGNTWGSHVWTFLGIEYTAIRELPASFSGITLHGGLALTANRLEAIEDAALDNKRLTFLILSGNPLTRLPASFDNVVELRRVMAEHTLVQEPPSWLTTWLDRDHTNGAADRIASLYGSPYCVQRPDDGAICGADAESIVGDYPYRYVAPQRPWA